MHEKIKNVFKNAKIFWAILNTFTIALCGNLPIVAVFMEVLENIHLRMLSAFFEILKFVTSNDQLHMQTISNYQTKENVFSRMGVLQIT